MRLSEIIVPILIFGVIIFKQVKDYLLRKEQIKADAMVKAEEIAARNKIELEKLLYNEEQKANTGRQSTSTPVDDGTIEFKASEKMRSS